MAIGYPCDYFYNITILQCYNIIVRQQSVKVGQDGDSHGGWRQRQIHHQDGRIKETHYQEQTVPAQSSTLPPLRSYACSSSYSVSQSTRHPISHRVPTNQSSH